MTDTLPRYNWDQAAILGLATARGFGALGIKPATVRKWASRNRLEAAGRAPGGAQLYPVSDVVRLAGDAPPDD